MEKTIAQLLRCLKIEYIVFWVLVILTLALYELDVLPQGILIDDAHTSYMLEVLGVLLTVCLIPFSLRLFNLSLVHLVKQRALESALISYRRWSEIRLALLLAPALVNLSVYYWTLETTGLLCSAMVMLASFFCVPGMKRLRSELNLDNEEALEEDVLATKVTEKKVSETNT